MLNSTNILSLFPLIMYIALILWNAYACYKIQKKILLSLVVSIIFVTAGFIYIFFWLWTFSVVIKNPLGLSSWVLYPLNIFIAFVVTVGGIFAIIPFWRMYDNFRETGKFSFKNNLKL